MPRRSPGALPALPRTPGWARRVLRGGLIGRSRSVGTTSSRPPLAFISSLRRRRGLSCGERGGSPQLIAFFTSATIRFSSAAVSSLSAKAVGHMLPSSRFAASWKPNVEYLVLNFCALWKKQTILPSLAEAGIPYQVLGQRAGAAAVMIAWSRTAMARSGSDISAIFASTALSPASLFLVMRASAFSSRARSFIAARSWALNPLDFLLVAAPFVDFCARPFSVAFVSAIADLLSVLKQPENVAIRVADGGHQAAATDVAHGLGN